LEEFYKRITQTFIKTLNKREKQPNIDVNTLSDFGKYLFYETDINSVISDKLNKKQIVPGGSVLSSIGTGRPVSLSNCFVLSPPQDTIESIFNTARDIAQIAKRRGGTGVDISNLRPADSVVNNAAKTSTGSVSWLDLYSSTTSTVG